MWSAGIQRSAGNGEGTASGAICMRSPLCLHVGPAHQGPKLRPGMIFTIEPMINAGGPEWKLLKDGWDGRHG